MEGKEKDVPSWRSCEGSDTDGPRDQGRSLGRIQKACRGLSKGETRGRREGEDRL